MRPAAPVCVAGISVPVMRCGVLVIGSGAAGLGAADALARAALLDPDSPVLNDVAVLTESLSGGTSVNTGSDKQTYYRLDLSGPDGDSVDSMAHALFDGGAVHGDIALAEAAGSLESFYRLVSLGVPFPQDRTGCFAGYKTDHDPKARGSSVGPYTSRRMVERLAASVRRAGIPVIERKLCVALLADSPVRDEKGALVRHGRVFGAVFFDLDPDTRTGTCGLELVVADAVIFAPGGPGGLYGASVYPAVHRGGIGLAVEIGATCANLTESQFGLASAGFRWNLSGSYQQVVPRYVSIGPDGEEHEFLDEAFDSPGERDSAVFLKGYQWPFDPRKVEGMGSSLVDLLVYRERELLHRQVCLDYTRNPSGWNPATLSPEAREYLERCGAIDGTPWERLVAMNPEAARHYADAGYDLSRSMLEIAVCAQHSNGGLAADDWWESVDFDCFFPVGEVNGSHGVYRPGGAALNAGQVGGARAARRIAGAYSRSDVQDEDWRQKAESLLQGIFGDMRSAGILPGTPEGAGPSGAPAGHVDPETFAAEFRTRMDRHAGIFRSLDGDCPVRAAADEALAQFARRTQLSARSPCGPAVWFESRHLVLAHAAYLDAIARYMECGGGSRGSSLVTGSDGIPLPVPGWNLSVLPENPALRSLMQTTRYERGRFVTEWIPCRPLLREPVWFETVWRTHREGGLHGPRRGAWSRSS